MFKKLGLLFITLLLGAQLWASSATFARIKNWTDLEVLYSADLNAEFNNILNNLGPAGIGAYSTNTTEMRSTADPYPGLTESLATSLQGELERLRYQILQIKNSIQASSVTYWYQDLPTAGVFTIAGSSVGINNTTPDYMLDVAGTLGVDGVVTVSTITSTLPTGVSIATHTAITGNLTVSGTFSPNTLTVASTVTYSGASRVYALSSATTITGLAGASYTVTGWTEQLDTLNEFNGSTFTATNTGNYLVCANIGFDQAIAADLTQATAATFINGTRFDGIGYTLGRAAGQNLIWVNGCILEPLTAGNALTIRAGTDNAGSGVNPIVETGDGGGSNLSIIRIW